MSTKSLVGPMNKKEIEFFVTWLALAYRSKSSMLGFGVDKTPVASDSFCLHQEDGSPKYELGSRPLPGKAEPLKGVFEAEVDEVDDFLTTPVVISPSKSKKRKASKSPESPQVGNDTTSADASKKRKRGRSVNSIEFSSPATASKKPKEMKSPDLTLVLDSTATWTCHNCDTANPESKKRCSGCVSWRGGKRVN